MHGRLYGLMTLDLGPVLYNYDLDQAIEHFHTPGVSFVPFFRQVQPLPSEITTILTSAPQINFVCSSISCNESSSLQAFMSSSLLNMSVRFLHLVACYQQLVVFLALQRPFILPWFYLAQNPTNSTNNLYLHFRNGTNMMPSCFLKGSRVFKIIISPSFQFRKKTCSFLVGTLSFSGYGMHKNVNNLQCEAR